MKSAERGSLLLELLVAFAVLTVLVVPIVTGFGTGVRQTQAIRSYVSARCVAEALLAEARADVASGGAQPEDADVTQDVRGELAAVARQLQELSVRRVVEPKGTSGKLFLMTVTVRWSDPHLAAPRQVVACALERSEL